MINNYTTQGRAEIHKNLANIDMSTLHYLMNNIYNDERAEFYNNKIALYSGQNGKCFITGEVLEVGNIHCHHKTPYHKNKDDSYNNMVLVTANVHKLLHATEKETIEHYKNLINPNRKQVTKINKLRKMLGNSSL